MSKSGTTDFLETKILEDEPGLSQLYAYQSNFASTWKHFRVISANASGSTF
jgi:hypothetical protein